MKKKIVFGLAFVLILSALLVPNFAKASTNDFTIANFQADYYLGKDSEDRSTLKTVEKITAVFPNYDQNHGIERALPLSFSNHPVSLSVLSVTDENGSAINYTTKSGNYLTLRIGDTSAYVHGSKTYVITYTQRDVTKYYSNTGDDEFYWDVNGTGWLQNFELVTANIHLDDSLAASLNGKMSCYYGAFGENNQCQINKTGNVITATAENLPAGHNLTFAIGFNKGTFNAYKQSSLEAMLNWAILGLMAASFVFLIGLIIYKFTIGKGAASAHAIVPEYLPPKEVDIVQSSVIINRRQSWFSAACIDLAVRHKIRVIETEEKFIFSVKVYKLELIAVDGLNENDQKLIKILFGENYAIGSVYNVKTAANDFVMRIYNMYRSVVKSMTANDYYQKQKAITIFKVIIGLQIPLAIGLLVTSIFINTVSALPMIMIYVMFLLVIVQGCVCFSIKPLSDKGRELADYLEGLKMYIKIAEQDRLRYLQSPTGAEKTPIDVNDKTMLVHLYERVLPYAVLFGQEKGWSKVLGDYYAQNQMQPDWYSGNAIFNAALFSSTISNLSTSMNSNATYSSSSGGAGGGGFSGGGGGGGGGGGW